LLGVYSNTLTVQKGKPTVLICVDGQLQSTIENETEEQKEIGISLLKRINGDANSKILFEFKLNTNGFIDGGSPWTDTSTYRNGKFEAKQNENGETGIEITKSGVSDDGEYTCRVKVHRSPLTFDKQFNVTVHVPPQTNPPQANVLVDSGTYNSFEEVAYCNALNGKPAAQVDWILPTTIDLGDIRNETTISTDNNNYKTMMTKSVLRLVPRKRYNGLLATCQITHPTLIKPVYYTLNISVEYRPSEPKITPYFKSDLLSCEASGNPAPRIDWIYFPIDQPSLRHQKPNSYKLDLQLDGQLYNYSCVASNKHGTTKTMTSSLQLAKRQKFLEANLNIIVGAGIGTLIALLLIGFCVCYCTLKSNRNKYKSEIKFPAESVQLHPDIVPYRPSPPVTRAPDLVESDNDSFIGDDVDLADDPFVRSHSILQSSQHHHHNSSFDQAMSDVYPTNRYNNYHQSYDYQPSEVTYSSQNTHRFKDIPAAYTYQNGDILHQSGSPIDARQLSQSQVYETPPPPGEMRQPNYREEGELHLRDLPPFAPPPPPRTHQQNTPQYSY